MKAGDIISIRLKDWPEGRWGQVLLVQWDEMTVKLLGSEEVLYLSDWVFSFEGNRQALLAHHFLYGDTMMPIKTIVYRSIRRRSQPSRWHRWKAWTREGQYRHYSGTKGNLPWDKKGAAGFWQLRYRLRGILCVDGYLVPMGSRWRQKPYYMEQYNHFQKEYPDIWQSITTNLRSTN